MGWGGGAGGGGARGKEEGGNKIRGVRRAGEEGPGAGTMEFGWVINEVRTHRGC